MATMPPSQARRDYESQKLDEALRLSEIPSGYPRIPVEAARILSDDPGVRRGDAAAEPHRPSTFRIPGRRLPKPYNTAVAKVVALLLAALMFVVVVLTLYL